MRDLRSQLSTREEIPTSPMADIAFLLIIFFMVTMTFSVSRGLDFALPEDEPEGPVDLVESVLVEVMGGGHLRVDQRPMELSELLPYLAPKLDLNPAKPVILSPRQDAAYGDVVAVYDLLRQGRERLGLPRDIQITLPVSRQAPGFWY